MSSLQKVSKRNVDIFILPNCNRFNHRRKPQPFSDINDPITPESFNFNKVPTREILLNVFEKHNTVLRKQSLYSAVKCFLLSANRYLCMGFNSLLAHASVNHLHFHFWQSPDYLRAMSTEIKPKYEDSMFFELVDHPVDNFVLELTDLTVLDQFMDHLWMLVMSCQQLRIAHNVFIARSKSSGYMRVVVWPRCSAFGAKNVSAVDSEVGFYVAVAELAGMLVVASEDIASTLNYDKVESILSNERLPENTLHILQCTLFEALRTKQL
ncbi:unnamed protein product [Heterobilharzia americana]|nr:unnamed protein product [Heterobilharzia americana]